MVSGRPFIYKKQYKIYFLFGIIVHASACSIPIREYEFPEQSFLEQRRMCQQVSSRKSKQYMVVDRKVLPMKKDEIMAPIQNTESDLQQGFIIVEFFKHEIIAVPLIRHADWMVRNVDFKDNKKIML